MRALWGNGMGLSAGTRLGPYEIESPLGAGGMGEVYRARDTRLERTVAVKVLKSALVATAELKARFEREAKVISQLQHPNICVLHDVGSEDGTDFLVMEFLEGESLADRLRKGPLPTEELLRIGIQIADGLEKAHRAGVVHRDLKPGNVMLTKTGAKLLDFGLAKPLAIAAATSTPSASVFSAALTQTSPAPSPSSPLSTAGSLVGTVQYMSPEQIQGVEADARSDIFAFGVMLFEMATGKRAFEGKTQASIVGQILAVDPPSVTTLRPEVPGALERIIRLCLDKDPDERVQSVHDLKLQLQFVDVASTAAAASTGETTTGGTPRWLAWTLATGLAMTAGIFGFMYWRTMSKVIPPIRALMAAPTDTRYYENSFAISPDGTKWVFVAVGKANTRQLWVRALDSLTAQPLNGTEDATYPFWSPDSRYVGFFSGGKLKRIDASGGPAQSLCDAANGRGGSWSRDGVIVFTPTASAGIFRIADTGGVPVEVTKLDKNAGEVTHRWPWFLPDGKHFLFQAIKGGGENQRGVYVASLDSPERHFVLYTDWNAEYSSGRLLYWRDNAVVAQPFDLRTFTVSGDSTPIAEDVSTSPGVTSARFSVSENGSMAYFPGGTAQGWQPYMADATGKPIGEPLPKALYFGPSVSLDGKRIAVSLGDASGKRDIWVIDIARHTPSRLTFDGQSSGPAWAPDGKLVYYSSFRNGNDHIFAKQADGSGSEQPILGTGGINETVTGVSRDGRYLLYARTPSAQKTEIWVLPLFGDRKPFPLVHDGFDSHAAEFSPDGKFVSYVNNSSGVYETYITPFPSGGAKWQVTAGGGGVSRWRGDGKMLFFTYARGLGAVTVTEVGNAVALSTPQTLMEPHLVGGPMGPFSLASQDGKRFLLNATDSNLNERTDAVVLTNWPAELKR